MITTNFNLVTQKLRQEAESSNHSGNTSTGVDQLMHSKLLKRRSQSPTNNQFVMEQLHQQQGSLRDGDRQLEPLIQEFHNSYLNLTHPLAKWLNRALPRYSTSFVY